MEATRMKMVNGRVNERSVAKAARVLKGQGLTVSAFIRNSIEYVAQMGTVPESGFGASPSTTTTRDQLRNFIQELEAKPMPGKLDYPGLNEDELVKRLRLERYGY